MAKKRKVPKKIAGVKLPKPLRRGLRDLAASQNGRTVLIEALTAADAALAASQARPGSRTRRAAAKQAPKLDAAGDAVRDSVMDARDATVAAFEDAARSFTDALRRRGLVETPDETSGETPGLGATTTPSQTTPPLATH
jgi:hypothetical protein